MTTAVRNKRGRSNKVLVSFALPPFPEFVRRDGARAACANVEPELFWPMSYANEAEVERARAVCRRCPLQPDCAEHAIEHELDHGLWAGMTPDERRAERRRRGLA